MLMKINLEDFFFSFLKMMARGEGRDKKLECFIRTLIYTTYPKSRIIRLFEDKTVLFTGLIRSNK